MSIIGRGTLIGPKTFGPRPPVPVFKRDGGRPAAELSADGRGPLSVSLGPPKPNSPAPHSATQRKGPLHPRQSHFTSRSGEGGAPPGLRGGGGRGPEGQAGGARASSREPKGLLGGGGCPGRRKGPVVSALPPVGVTCVLLSSGVRLQLAACVTLTLRRLHAPGVHHHPRPRPLAPLQPLWSPCHCQGRPGPASEPQLGAGRSLCLGCFSFSGEHRACPP